MATKKEMAVKVKALLEQGTTLSGKHEAYVETYIQKGNEKLGLLLAELFAYALEVLAMPNLDQVIKKLRRTLRVEYGIKTQLNSPNLNIIVRYVIRKDRKTAHVYARVLQVAIDAGVQPADFPEFLQANGGIERIRQSTVSREIIKAKEKKQEYNNDNAIAYARFYFEDLAKNPMATFTIPAQHETAIYDAARFGSFHYMICHVVNGKYMVVGALPMYEELDDQLMIQSINHLHECGFHTDNQKASMAVAKQQVVEWRQRLAKREAMLEKERLEREQSDNKKTLPAEAANDAHVEEVKVA